MKAKEKAREFERTKRNETLLVLVVISCFIFLIPLWAGRIPGDIIHMDIVNLMVLAGIYGCSAVGLNLLIGFAGQISLGHAAFFGIGAYSVAILTTRFTGFPTWLGIIIGAFISGVVGYLVGLPVLKLKGHYLAMATLGLGEIAFIFFREATGLTKGTVGITAIPSLSLFGASFDTNTRLFYVVWVTLLLMMLFSINLVHSQVGRALRALRSSEIAAEVMGIDTSRYKAAVFVISAVFTGIGGGLFAVFQRYVNPECFHLTVSILFLTMVVVGGLGNIWGAIIGSVVITFLPSIITALPYWLPFMPKSLLNFGNYILVLYGILLIFFMMFMPKGIAYAGSMAVKRSRRYAKRVRDRVSAVWYSRRG